MALPGLPSGNLFWVLALEVDQKRCQFGQFSAKTGYQEAKREQMFHNGIRWYRGLLGGLYSALGGCKT